jgi:hypothetical protein
MKILSAHISTIHTEMKSPACTQNKWGKGTTTDRVPDTDASKEMKARLAAVMAEREKQDCMWTAPVKVEEKPVVTLISKK